ncbi:MAG: phytase [Litorimonas sp.]
MSRTLATAALSLSLLTACARMDPAYQAVPISADFETPIMASTGDSADDPAIFVNPNGGGFIAATDKQAGLYIYTLGGEQREFMPIGTINNVDLRSGVAWQGVDYVLLAASNDETNEIEFILYDPATDEFSRPETSSISVGDFSPYGICMGRSANDGLYIGLTSKAGIYQQYLVNLSSADITARKVREFKTGTKTEGCVFDDRTRQLYIAEETGSLYQYPAAPSGKDEPIILMQAGDYGSKADLEGVTIYPEGEDGGYLIVSSQGNNSYVTFSLPEHEFSGRITIVDGAVDGVTTTDGIDVTATATPQFPNGFLVVQDDEDDSSPSQRGKRQNLKVVDWRTVQAALLN